MQILITAIHFNHCHSLLYFLVATVGMKGMQEGSYPQESWGNGNLL